MSKGKWGESFLKSGLPLEHLTVTTLKSLGWTCHTGFEYQRKNREGTETWFELDVEGFCSEVNNEDSELSFLIECKYHDLSRFWFFMPLSPDRWYFDDRFLNFAPLPTLVEPKSTKFGELAPCSMGGIVVAEDGTKQDNSVHTATQQLLNGFIPYSLTRSYLYNIDYQNSIGDPLNFMPSVTATILMIVTNASIFRLKPEITDLDIIRQATTPHEIADELNWTWCYQETSMSLIDQNLVAIEEHKQKYADLIYRFPLVEEHLSKYYDRPNWIAVVNIKHLQEATKAITQQFLKLPTFRVKDLIRKRTSSRRKK